VPILSQGISPNKQADSEYGVSCYFKPYFMKFDIGYYANILLSLQYKAQSYDAYMFYDA